MAMIPRYPEPVLPSVRVERVEARPLAVVRRTSSRKGLPRDIIAGLDVVWPVLRSQGVVTGQNVVIYRGGVGELEIGVEVPNGFDETAEVRRSATPAGDAVSATHWGEYSAMRPAYDAIQSWCDAHGRRGTGVSWEVYGDWADDPADLRTDIYVLLEAGG
jgi:effector-binding domain-containing protein